MKINIGLWSYFAQVFLEREISQTKAAHLMYNIFFLNRALCEIMWKSNECIAGQTKYDSIIKHMRIACWIPKATNTHSECAIFIPFVLQQWLHIRVSMLRCTYIVSLNRLICIGCQSKNNYVCNIQLRTSYTFRPFRVRPSSGWIQNCQRNYITIQYDQQR
jgi:hypothetical protein